MKVARRRPRWHMPDIPVLRRQKHDYLKSKARLIYIQTKLRVNQECIARPCSIKEKKRSFCPLENLGREDGGKSEGSCPGEEAEAQGGWVMSSTDVGLNFRVVLPSSWSKEFLTSKTVSLAGQWWCTARL